MNTALALATRPAELPQGGALAIEPETITPAQFFGTSGIGAGLQPEKRLMLAVLEDAVATYQKTATVHGTSPRRLFLETDHWFAQDDHEWPFSFVNICGALDLDAGALRAGLRRWRERQLALPEGQRRVTRSPFRRINGTRTKTTGEALGLRPRGPRRRF